MKTSRKPPAGEGSAGTTRYPEPEKAPAGPERFRGSGRRYEWRVYGAAEGQRYEVYAPGLVQMAECLTAEAAELVCDALNALPENNQSTPDRGRSAEEDRYAVLADLGRAVRNSVEIVRALRRLKRRGENVPIEVMHHSQGRCQMARELYRAVRQRQHNAASAAAEGRNS